MSRHPIASAYRYADPGRPCPNCRAPAYAWCLTPDGTVRRIPCVARFRAGITDAPEVEHPDIDPDQPQLPPARTASLLDQIHHHHEGTAHD